MIDPTAPVVNTMAPEELSEAELNAFVALVQESGEVSPIGLRGRVLRAHILAMALDSSGLLGVAGLKRPSAHHRVEIEGGSQVRIGSDEFAYELGWVFVKPQARRRGISLSLGEAILRHAVNTRVFSTSNTLRTAMHRTLTKLGFERVGSTWPSAQNTGEQLALFVR